MMYATFALMTEVQVDLREPRGMRGRSPSPTRRETTMLSAGPQPRGQARPIASHTLGAVPAHEIGLILTRDTWTGSAPREASAEPSFSKFDTMAVTARTAI